MNKPIFKSHNPDIEKNAYMNWRTSNRDQMHNMCVFADGYALAAKILAESILVDNSDKKADGLVYPILFDINQCIELYLKTIQWQLNMLLGKPEKFDGGHNLVGHYGKLTRLLNDFDNKYPEARGNKKDFNSMMSGVKDYIDEIKAMVPEKELKSMDFPRYPVMSDKETKHFYIKDVDNVTIDVEYLLTRAEEMRNALESLTLHFGEMIESQEEVLW